MSACLNDGQLQAYVDGEAASDHVAACVGCSKRAAELRAASMQVSELLDVLGESVPLPAIKKPRRLWPVGIAAAIALAAIFLHFKRSEPKEVDYFYTLGDPAETIQQGTVVPVRLPMSVFDASAPASLEVNAEVLLGDDGRAHAIRFIQQQ